VALALGFEGSGRELAALCQRAEQLASGVPCGIMDQLTSALGIDGHALLIDFTTLDIDPVPVPPLAEIIVVHSGQERELAGSAYAERRAACERAASEIGPLREATLDDVAGIDDPIIRRRATHVVYENQRVRDFARAFRAGNLREAGRLMVESHASLRDLFEVSTPELDALVEALCEVPGIFGARLTGAGFGGCVVALGDERAVDALAVSTGVVVPGLGPRRGWRVRAAAGARLLD
jgi:galactokinase